MEFVYFTDWLERACSAPSVIRDWLACFIFSAGAYASLLLLLCQWKRHLRDSPRLASVRSAFPHWNQPVPVMQYRIFHVNRVGGQTKVSFRPSVSRPRLRNYQMKRCISLHCELTFFPVGVVKSFVYCKALCLPVLTLSISMDEPTTAYSLRSYSNCKHWFTTSFLQPLP